MDKPLYVISAEYRAKVDDLLERGVDTQTIADTMEGEGWEFQQKMEAVGYAIKEAQAKHAALATAIKEMEKRRDTCWERIENLKNYVLNCLKIAGESRVETEHYLIVRHKNPYKVVIDNYEAVPKEYLLKPPTYIPIPDKTKIRDAIKSGIAVEGCHIEQDERLRIK